ncbi:Uncharacterised protein [Klebsiella pneumoniae subsp. ozaenae]|uniref:Uncharacterized protein n=1 Tax=Klebsiella pneumoniae subsp. ozaenae TaxID=574 RepID=A0A377ZZV3_KLEPO|nr:Uncharacterised protein [Klebsiella pneumoniae subsp. ozaenae]
MFFCHRLPLTIKKIFVHLKTKDYGFYTLAHAVQMDMGALKNQNIIFIDSRKKT